MRISRNNDQFFSAKKTSKNVSKLKKILMPQKGFKNERKLLTIICIPVVYLILMHFLAKSKARPVTKKLILTKNGHFYIFFSL